jgi:hypothetical protein
MPDILIQADAVSVHHQLRESVCKSVLSLLASAELLDRRLSDEDSVVDESDPSGIIQTVFHSSLVNLVESLQVALTGSSTALTAQVRGDTDVDLVATRQLWLNVRADLIENIDAVKSLDIIHMTTEQLPALLDFSTCLEALITALDVELFGDDVSGLLEHIRQSDSKSCMWLNKVLPLQNLLVSAFNKVAMALIPSNQCAV